MLARQPYIQNVTSSSVDVMWKTNTGGTSVVRYGPTTTSGTEVAGTPGRTSIGAAATPTPNQVSYIHFVRIAGLQPDTRYRYQIVTDGAALSPVNDDYFFDTAPATGSTAPFSFAGVGDIGNGSTSEGRVANIIDLVNPDACGVGGWPSNLTDEGTSANKLDIADVVSFLAPVRTLDTSPPDDPGYSPRWDLAPGANPPFQAHINIQDLITLMAGPPGSPAYPPMFGGGRACGKTCPFPP